MSPFRDKNLPFIIDKQKNSQTIYYKFLDIHVLEKKKNRYQASIYYKICYKRPQGNASETLKVNTLNLLFGRVLWYYFFFSIYGVKRPMYLLQ